MALCRAHISIKAHSPHLYSLIDICHLNKPDFFIKINALFPKKLKKMPKNALSCNVKESVKEFQDLSPIFPRKLRPIRLPNFLEIRSAVFV